MSERPHGTERSYPPQRREGGGLARRTQAYGAQTTFSAGRPGVLKDPAPQGAVTVGYVAAPGPLLKVASLAGGDGVDATTVSYFLSVALAKKKGGGGEGEGREGEEAEGGLGARSGASP